MIPLGGINIEVVVLFAFRSGCSGAFTDVRAHLFSSPHGSHRSQAAATRVTIFVFYHDFDLWSQSKFVLWFCRAAPLPVPEPIFISR